MRPVDSACVASMQNIAAPDSARLLMWVKCQSLASPFSAEYWHIGATMMRLRRFSSRSLIGENRALMRGIFRVAREGGPAGHLKTHWWDYQHPGSTPIVVPAKAGTHNPRAWLSSKPAATAPHREAAPYRSLVAGRWAGTKIIRRRRDTAAGSATRVVPAKAGPDSPRAWLSSKPAATAPHREAAAYGSLLSLRWRGNSVSVHTAETGAGNSRKLVEAAEAAAHYHRMRMASWPRATPRHRDATQHGSP